MSAWKNRKPTKMIANSGMFCQRLVPSIFLRPFSKVGRWQPSSSVEILRRCTRRGYLVFKSFFTCWAFAWGFYSRDNNHSSSARLLMLCIPFYKDVQCLSFDMPAFYDERKKERELKIVYNRYFVGGVEWPTFTIRSLNVPIRAVCSGNTLSDFLNSRYPSHLEMFLDKIIQQHF